MRRIDLEHITGHQPVEQHAEGRQVLLDNGRREPALQLLDEGRDVERLHLSELVQAARLAPGRETPGGVEVGLAGVIIVDLRGEEFEEAPGGFRGRREEPDLSYGVSG
jgi:hypothetical protein